MKIPRIINGDLINNKNSNEEKQNNTEKNINVKNILPFLKIELEKNLDIPDISHRVEKAKILINSQTDKLLEEGFLGNEEDFQKYYSRYAPQKIKKMISIKRRKFNNFLIKGVINEPLKLTKTKEFNLTSSKKNKLFVQFSKLNQNKQHHYNTKNINIKKINRNHFNNLFLDNNTHKTNQINSSNSNSISRNILSSNGSFNNIFDKSDSNSINKKFGSTFYFYKKNTKKRIINIKSSKNRPISLKNFMTLRNILNDTSQNISDIHSQLKRYKKYFKRNNSTNILKSKSITTKNNNNNNDKNLNLLFNSENEEESKLKEVLSPLKKKKEEKELKLIRRDDGLKSQNIWIRRSTANLITFGKSFMNLDDIRFYKESKRFMDDYPKLEKDANLNDNNHKKKISEMNEIKLQRKKLNQNIKKINDLYNMNTMIFKKLRRQIKEIKNYK